MDIQEYNSEYSKSLSYVVNGIPSGISFNDVINISDELKNINNFYVTRLISELCISIQRSIPINNMDDEIYNVWNYLKLYNDKHRYYHNIHHIMFCLDTLYSHSEQLLKYISIKEFDIVKIALMFHDMIHTTKGKEKIYQISKLESIDEEASARVAIKLLEPICKFEEGEILNLELIGDIIRSTDHTVKYLFDIEKRTEIDQNREHNLASSLKSIVCDIDLFILASNTSRFERYRKNIRKEYIHLSDDIWKKNSIIFANKFLNDRESIFSCPVFKEYEDKARQNLLTILNNKGI